MTITDINTVLWSMLGLVVVLHIVAWQSERDRTDIRERMKGYSTDGWNMHACIENKIFLTLTDCDPSLPAIFHIHIDLFVGFDSRF